MNKFYNDLIPVVKPLYVFAILILLSTATFAAFMYHKNNSEFKNAPTQIAGCTDPAVTAIVYSIQHYPDRWERDNFKMWHGNDVSIWVANEDYGLSLNMGSKNAEPDQYDMSDQCRALLYDVTQTWTRNTLNEKLRS